MDQNSPDGQDRPSLPPVDNVARRRMLRRGLGTAVPVVTTLASGPVNAGSCLLASGFVSAPTFNSRHPQGFNACAGKSPTDWNATSTWPSCNKTDYFNVKIGSAADKYKLSKDGSKTPGPTLAQVLASPTTMAAHIVAMWLNAKDGRTAGVFTTSQVVSIWQNIIDNGGGYKITSQPAWTAQRTLDWIKQTWT